MTLFKTELNELLNDLKVFLDDKELFQKIRYFTIKKENNLN